MPFENELEEIKGLETFLDDIVSYELPNGVKVNFLSVPEMEYVDASVNINRGALHEKEGEFGKQHWLEHMLFYGPNKKYSVFTLPAARKKLSLNAEVGFTETFFFGKPETNQVSEYLNLVSSMIFNPKFNDSTSMKNPFLKLAYYAINMIQTARITVQLAMSQGDALDDLIDLRKKILGDSRFAYPIDGNLDVINNLRASGLADYYRDVSFGSASATNIFLVGKLPENVESLVSNSFLDQPSGEPKLDYVLPTDLPILESPSKKVVSLRKNAKTSEIYLRWQAPHVSDERNYWAMQLFLEIFNSYANEKLSGSYPVNSFGLDYHMTNQGKGYIALNAVLNSTVSYDSFISNIFSLFEDLKESNYIESKLEEIKSTFISSYSSQLKDKGNLINFVQDFVTTHKKPSYYCNLIADLSKTDLIGMAKEWIPREDSGYVQLVRLK